MSTNTNEIAVTRPGEGRIYNVMGARLAVLSTGRKEHMAFVDHPVPAGFAVPQHIHHDEDEMIFVLDGTITFIGAQGGIEGRPGTFLHIPRGVPHGFANRTGQEARMLAVASAGGGLEGIFRELDAIAGARAPDPAQVGSIMHRNDAALMPA